MSGAKLEARLRQVLELIAGDHSQYNTIADSQGDFLGHDQFVGVSLIEDAKALLRDWNEEDARATASPSARAADGVEGVS